MIDAINADMPFDRFAVEQIAGDLIEESGDRIQESSNTPELAPASRLLTPERRSRLIATGFNRNTTVNVEAGTDPEEDRVKQVVDRVNTTATVFLGLTIECAQCHDHKYDPITQAEYFGLFAYFNNTPIESKRYGSATLQFESPELELPIDQPRQVERRLAVDHRKRLREIIEQAKSAGAEAVEIKRLQDDLARTERRIKELTPTTLVMQELPEPRETYLMKRGDFLSPGERIVPGVPRALHALPTDAAPNRLGVARWLASAENPLIARVTVNRWWAEFFGNGIVTTLEDFGSQGEPPTHPELLDWLAVEFIESGWSMKQIHRLIVTSSTYRQSSAGTSPVDPENKLLWRGPRLRLPAEMIRDHALAAAGLLSRKMHGPPVRPPQPPDVWRVTGFVDNTYRPSDGEDRYRRGIYAIRRRSGPYPSFSNFDAPDRAACTVQRPRSNTPLQALTLMNDEVYVEAAGALARQMLAGSDSDSASDVVEYAFARVLSRAPTAAERSHLEAVYDTERRHYAAHLSAAEALAARVGAGVAPEEAAAWFIVATILLNLDEAITKN